MPNEDVKPIPVRSTGISCEAVTDPKLDVKPNPDNATEYSTPQAELPHSCLPQPSSLKAFNEPTEPVKD